MEKLKQLYLVELNRRYIKATSNLRHIRRVIKLADYYMCNSKVKECIDVHTKKYNDYYSYEIQTIKKINDIIKKSELEIEKPKYVEFFSSKENLKYPLLDVLFETEIKI